jgi:hypothetical protein
MGVDQTREKMQPGRINLLGGVPADPRRDLDDFLASEREIGPDDSIVADDNSVADDEVKSGHRSIQHGVTRLRRARDAKHPESTRALNL